MFHLLFLKRASYATFKNKKFQLTANIKLAKKTRYLTIQVAHPIFETLWISLRPLTNYLKVCNSTGVVCLFTIWTEHDDVFSHSLLYSFCLLNGWIYIMEVTKQVFFSILWCTEAAIGKLLPTPKIESQRHQIVFVQL